MSSVVQKKKRRNPDAKALVTEMQQQFETITVHLSRIVEYLQITEHRLKELEKIIDRNCMDINQLKSSVPYKSPEFNTMHYIPWSKPYDSETVVSSSSSESLCFDDIDFDNLEKDVDNINMDENILLEMSPFDLAETEHPLFCNEVME
jgi:hypothetical protein